MEQALFCGVDEAGRGCLAGPVVAAACILKPDYEKVPLLRDSKTLDETQREQMRIWVEENALCFAVGMASNEEIDQFNILQATFMAMHRAIEKIANTHSISGLYIDGNRFKPYPWISHECVVKGDSKIPAISAASIIAKTERDRLMVSLALEFPAYLWAKNKGYPTPEHKAAIKEYGYTPHHRLTFKI